MKNSKQLFKRGLLSCMVAALAMGFAVAEEENQEGTEWTEVTEYFIVNPDYSNGTTGWTDGTVVPAVNYHNAELYQTNATVLQTITGLQPGTYKVTVQAFHREKDNDGGANHEAGSEDIQAFLVAGTNEVAIKSLYSEVEDKTVTKNSNGWPDTQQGAMEYFNEKHPGSYMNE